MLAGRWLVGNEQYNNIAGTGGVARMSRKGKAWGDQNGDKSQWNKKDSWFPADECGIRPSNITVHTLEAICNIQ